MNYSITNLYYIGTVTFFSHFVVREPGFTFLYMQYQLTANFKYNIGFDSTNFHVTLNCT